LTSTGVSLGIVSDPKIRRFDRAAARALALALLLGVLLLGSAPAPAQAEPDSFFGVVTQRKLESRDYDRMRDGRFGSLRVALEWHSMQPRRGGEINWKQVDGVFEEATERGIDVLPSIYGTPSWLHHNWRTLPVENAAQIEAWREFLDAAVSRYGRDGSFWVQRPKLDYRPVRTWQVWNEPNIVTFARPVSPRRYGRLLTLSAATIQAFDPDARIATGGFYGSPPDGKGIDSARFLHRMYKVPGVASSFDVAAVHPYAHSARESLRRTNPIRTVLNRHGNVRRPILITELGWGSDSRTVFGKGSQRAQAAEVRAAYRIFLNQKRRLKLEGIYWFSWSDISSEVRTCAFCFATGFFDLDGNPKPAWHEVLNFTRGI